LELSDTTLISSALSGSQKAYASLTARHRQSVYHIVYKIIRNTDTTNDLVQETFMKAFVKHRWNRLNL